MGPKSFIGAGAIVTKNTEENGLYIGTPARLQTKSSFEI
jgi:acetyltransferase-like isoleucine patch superfamily enzyme